MVLRSLFLVVLLVGLVAGNGCVSAGRKVATPAPVAPPVSVLPPDTSLMPSRQQESAMNEAGALALAQRRTLAAELDRLWTRSSRELVDVIDEASRSAPATPPVTLLLAIAHAETNGRILDVSEAGAVGLAQATPVAYLQENFRGRLFVSEEYVSGLRAYITKKPLLDAWRVAMTAAEGGVSSMARACSLLEAAYQIRQEGLDEIELLESYGPADTARRTLSADRLNLQRLEQVETLLQRPDPIALKEFATGVRREYDVLKEEQRVSWRRYQMQMTAQRDRLLNARYGATFLTLDDSLMYEAGEYLATQLDERFSAKSMAAFLVQHLEAKRVEATVISPNGEAVEALTAALYNGGAQNVKRLRTGLLISLPETDNYMRKVPSTRRRLDASLDALRIRTRPPSPSEGISTGQ